MRIVVDANILVAGLLRKRGQALIASAALELYIAEKAWSETQHEIHRRVAIIEQQGRIAPGTGNALAVAATWTTDTLISFLQPAVNGS